MYVDMTIFSTLFLLSPIKTSLAPGQDREHKTHSTSCILKLCCFCVPEGLGLCRQDRSHRRQNNSGRRKHQHRLHKTTLYKSEQTKTNHLFQTIHLLFAFHLNVSRHAHHTTANVCRVVVRCKSAKKWTPAYGRWNQGLTNYSSNQTWTTALLA